MHLIDEIAYMHGGKIIFPHDATDYEIFTTYCDVNNITYAFGQNLWTTMRIFKRDGKWHVLENQKYYNLMLRMKLIPMECKRRSKKSGKWKPVHITEVVMSDCITLMGLEHDRPSSMFMFMSDDADKLGWMFERDAVRHPRRGPKMLNDVDLQDLWRSIDYKARPGSDLYSAKIWDDARVWVEGLRK